MKVLKPNGEKLIVPPNNIINNLLTFTIKEDFMDELDEIGVYQLQISLYDSLNGKVTIPKIEFEVLEPIFEGDIAINYETGQVDITNSDMSLVAKESAISELESRIKYNLSGLYEWKFGDLISSNRLNDMSASIEKALVEIQTIKDSGISNINASNVKYNNSNFETVGQALDSLLYVPISIKSFECDSNIINEVGTVVKSVLFSWSINKDNILTQSINGVNISKSLRSYNYKVAFNQDRTFTLVVNDDKSSSTKSINFKFLNRIYYGSSSSNIYNENLIKSLNSELSDSRSKVFTTDASKNEYIYYAYPSRFGQALLSYNGFVGGFELVKTILVTNNGHSESYYLYKSDNHSLGLTSISVS